jgi:hypothetical protein
VNGQTIAAIVMAGVMVMCMLFTLAGVIWRMGVLSGQIITFMTSAQSDRTEVLTELGKIDERLERHIEDHARGAR